MSSTGSPDFTGKECAPYTTQWTFDTYQFGKSIAEAVPQLGKTWFIVTPDYLFGKTLEANVRRFVTAAGGKVVGSVVHPFGTNDMSSFMLQAQASGAQVIALANAGGRPDQRDQDGEGIRPGRCRHQDRAAVARPAVHRRHRRVQGRPRHDDDLAVVFRPQARGDGVRA